MIRGDALGGALVKGWHAPVSMEWHADGEAPRWAHGVVLHPIESGRVLWWSSDPYVGRDNRDLIFLRLDPTRPEVAHRIADVLRSLGHEVGPLLPLALGGRVGDGVEETVCCPGLGRSCDCNGGGAQPDGSRQRDQHDDGCRSLGPPLCPRCGDSGKIRRPVPAADRSARLLVASVRGVEEGRGVVRGVLGEWREVAPDVWERESLDGMPTADAVASHSSGWAVRATNIYARADLGTRGPETGPAGRAAADAAALELMWALDDPTAPGGLRVPGEVTDGR